MIETSYKKIAILGATSHIARGLIYSFSQKENNSLFLFGRSPDRINAFLSDINCRNTFQALAFNEFNNTEYDVVINCVGVGDPGKLKSSIASIFTLTETFDNLVLSYLERHPEVIYINFSSGAVYGTDFTSPVDESIFAKYDINHLNSSDYYGITKLNSEAKHRAQSHYNIVDLRVFGYFSRFIDLKTRYLISEIISCVKDKKEFVTGPGNIVRDYVHPEDLLSFIELCIKMHVINDVFDVCSLKPVAKFELLDWFASEYNLKYRVEKNMKITALTGTKDNYYSNNRTAQKIGYNPKYTSSETIHQEASEILGR